jgi:hypothetical protein
MCKMHYAQDRDIWKTSSKFLLEDCLLAFLNLHITTLADIDK